MLADASAVRVASPSSYTGNRTEKGLERELLVNDSQTQVEMLDLTSEESLTHNQPKYFIKYCHVKMQASTNNPSLQSCGVKA